MNGTLGDLGTFFSTVGRVIRQRAGALLYIAAAVWIPYTVIALAAANAAGWLAPLETAISQTLTPAQTPTPITWPDTVAAWVTAIALLLGYLWCAATSSGAVAHQTSNWLAGTPACGLTSLLWGIKTSRRTSLVFAGLILVAAGLAVASTLAVVATSRQLAIAGMNITVAVILATTWWPVAVAGFVAIYNRWSLAVTAAAIGRTPGNPFTVSWHATSRRFWPVLTRWLAVAGLAAIITGTIASISLVFGIFGLGALVAAAVATRIVTTAISGAAQITALTIIYQQTIGDTGDSAHGQAPPVAHR